MEAVEKNDITCNTQNLQDFQFLKTYQKSICSKYALSFFSVIHNVALDFITLVNSIKNKTMIVTEA